LVVEDAMFVEYVTSAELNVLRDGHVVRTSNTSKTVLDVVDQTLGHQRVLVQVHQVRRL